MNALELAASIRHDRERVEAAIEKHMPPEDTILWPETLEKCPDCGKAPAGTCKCRGWVMLQAARPDEPSESFNAPAK